MPQPTRPFSPPSAQDHAATCLETDEDVMQALRTNLAGMQPAPIPVPISAFPATRGKIAPAPATPPPRVSSAILFQPSVRPPMAVLTVYDDGKADGETFRLRDGRFVIGRTEGDLVIPHDAMISGRHVEITRQKVGGQHRWVITDLESTNGLFVRVLHTPLADGSEILVGNGRYRLLAPSVEPPGTADYVPLEAQRNSTQAWGNDGAAPAAASLVELIGNGFGNRLSLLQSEYWIGADAGCAICRPNDPCCEAQHARLSRRVKGGWQVEQGKSLNGLWFRVPQVIAENTVQFQIGEQRCKLKVGG